MSTKTRNFFMRTAGYSAAGWACIFALLHVVWAAGWYIGLHAEQARAAFQRPWFFRYNLAAAGMCVVAMILALTLTQIRKHSRTARLLSFFGWTVAAILGLRGVAGVVKMLYWVITERQILPSIYLWDFWFCLGAILFGAAVWKFRRA